MDKFNQFLIIFLTKKLDLHSCISYSLFNVSKWPKGRFLKQDI